MNEDSTKKRSFSDSEEESSLSQIKEQSNEDSQDKDKLSPSAVMKKPVKSMKTVCFKEEEIEPPKLSARKEVTADMVPPMKGALRTQVS